MIVFVVVLEMAFPFFQDCLSEVVAVYVPGLLFPYFHIYHPYRRRNIHRRGRRRLGGLGSRGLSHPGGRAILGGVEGGRRHLWAELEYLE